MEQMRLIPFVGVTIRSGRMQDMCLWPLEDISVIEVTRINGSVVLINSDLIECVEETPDSVITLTTGKRLIVKESRQDIKNLVKSYKQEIYGTVP